MPNIPVAGGSENAAPGQSELDMLIAAIEEYFSRDGLDADERVAIEKMRTELWNLAAKRQGAAEKALGLTAQHKAMARASGAQAV